MTYSSDGSNPIIHHAYKNIWCSPRQDIQYIVSPTRITPKRGARGNVEIDGRKFGVPSPKGRYSIFTMGDLLPSMVGMDKYVDTWVSAKAHCNSNSLFINIYNNDGVRFPVGEAFFLYTRYGSLVLALRFVEDQLRHDIQDIFIRWRTSHWFDDNNQIRVNDGIEVKGRVIVDKNDIHAFQNEVAQARTRPGVTLIYSDGQRIMQANSTTIEIGNYVEYVRDASIKEVIEYNVTELITFNSQLDEKPKYLLSRAGLGEEIDYKDDVEVHLLNYYKGAAYWGRYYHQNHQDCLRMLTHRDYSVPTAYVHGVVNAANGWLLSHDIRLEVTIRHSGLTRPLVDEHTRIKEMFKLPEEARLRAIVGEDATMEEWKARSLERSHYTWVMRAPSGEVSLEDVRETYGYNAVSKIIADTPVKRDPAKLWIPLPYSHIFKSTVYEYDAQGLLLGHYLHDYSHEYPVRNTTCRSIESYKGWAGDNLGTIFDTEKVHVEQGREFRCYALDKWTSAEVDWMDVTGDETFYSLIEDTIHWNVDLSKWNVAVKTDQCFLAKTEILKDVDKTYVFTVKSDGIYRGSVELTGVMEIAPGELDVFLNGYKLVEDIDYYVRWPLIAIVNKSFINMTGDQEVHIRARGFCTKDMQRSRASESGFVTHGMLSNDRVYNLRDDRINVISIAGKLVHMEDMAFDEDGAPEIESNLNGLPFSIVHPITPVKEVIGMDSYEYRDLSVDMDTRVSEYLSAHLPTRDPSPTGMERYYPLVSPLCNRLIHDMLLGNFKIEEFKTDFTDEFLRGKLSRYDWLLPFEPTVNKANPEFTVVQPHIYNYPLNLNVYHYRILDRTINLLFNNDVVLNRNVAIVEEGFEHDMRDHPHPRRE